MVKKSKYNKIPYIILSIFHGLLLFYTFYKQKDRKAFIVLWFTIFGFAHNFDYVILVLLKGYKYIPKIFNTKKFDNIMGMIFSQTLYVPSTALFITSFRLGWKVKLFFGFYFAIIEKLFIHLGIFHNYWWRTLCTAMLIPFYFFLSDVWYKQIKKRNPLILHLSFFHIIHMTWLNLSFILSLLRKIRGGFGIYHSWQEHFIVIKIYSLYVSLIITWFLKDGSNRINKIKCLYWIILSDFIIRKWSKITIKTHSYLTLLMTHTLVIEAVSRLRGLVYIDNEYKN